MSSRMPPKGVLQKGSHIGDDNRYLVTRKLGEGRFAEVWEIKDTEVLADQRVSAVLPGRGEWYEWRQGAACCSCCTAPRERQQRRQRHQE